MILERRAFRGSTVLAGMAGLLIPGAAAAAIFFEAVSTPAPDGFSYLPSISADGRFVAFTSSAALVPEDAIPLRESVYVRDRRTGTIELVSIPEPGGTDTGHSRNPSISADGRFVAFESTSQLVAQDGNVHRDVYVRDRRDRKTTLVSSQSSSVAGDPAISANGRFVAFDYADFVWVRDLDDGTIRQVAIGENPSISGNGQLVAFQSVAALTSDDLDEGLIDVYVKERAGTLLFLLDPGDDAGRTSFDPFISADGQVVVLKSTSNNATKLYTVDFLDISTFAPLGGPPPLTFEILVGTDPCLSGDGRLVAFTAATPADSGELAVYVLDRATGVSTLVRQPGGQESFFPSLSADGRHLAFASDQVYAADLDILPFVTAVAADSGGRFLAVWERADENGAPAVFARVYDRDGEAVSGDFQVNEKLTNQAPGGDPNDQGAASEPAVAAIGPGSFVVVWTGAGASVRLRFVTIDPEPSLGLEFNVSGSGRADSPSVAANGTGRFVIVWRSYGLPGDQNVRGKLFAGGFSGGQQIPFVVADSNSTSEIAPDAAMAADGSFAVAWASISDLNGTGIGNRRFDGGAVAIEPAAVVNRRTDGLRQVPALAPQPGGNYVAVWEAQQPGPGFGIFGRRLPPAAANPEFQVNSQILGDQRTPDIAADADGNLLVAWNDETTNSLKLQRLLASGAFVEEEVDLGPGTSRSSPPRLASLGDSRFALVHGNLGDVAALVVEPSEVYEECRAGLCVSESVWMPAESLRTLERRTLERRYAVPMRKAVRKP